MIHVLLVISLAMSMACAAAGQDFAVEDEFVRFVLGSNGSTRNLLDKSTGREWHAAQPQPFASVKAAGKDYPAVSFTRDGESWHTDFGPVQADFRITASAHYVVFELTRVHGEGVEEVRFGQVKVTCQESAGWWLGAYWNEQFAVALLGLSDRVNVQLLGNGVLAASVYPEFGMEGQRAVLVAAPSATWPTGHSGTG